MSAGRKTGWLRRLPIRGKLLLITMVTSLTAIVPTVVGFVAFAFVQGRNDLRDSAVATAGIIAANTTGALTFEDAGAARATLRSLAAESHVIAGCLYREGELFAAYLRSVVMECPPGPGQDGAKFENESLKVAAPVMVGDVRAGTIYLENSLDPVYSTLRTGLLFVPILFALSALVALWLSYTLQRLISGPVLNLARTARAISERRDYSLRAVGETEDELKTLVSAFNQMLEQIQKRDDELREAQSLLEQRVAERTEELDLRNRELGRINQQLDDFAYIASHDLKEPLRGIHNYCNFLWEDYEDAFDEEGRRKLATLGRLSRRMEAIIDSLLQYSRIDRGAPAVERVNLDLVLQEVLESLEHGLEEMKVDVRIPKPFPATLGDRAGIAEIFRNLVTNAAKYNDKEHKWIEISWLEQEAESIFYVRDNGIGISTSHQETVFKIFKRLHARDRFGGGTGAGLTIVRKLVERQGGRIWVESAPGHGSTFYFTLAGNRLKPDETKNAAHPAG